MIFFFLVLNAKRSCADSPAQLNSGYSIHLHFIQLSPSVNLQCLVKRSWALQECNPTRNSQADREPMRLQTPVDLPHRGRFLNTSDPGVMPPKLTVRLHFSFTFHIPYPLITLAWLEQSRSRRLASVW